MSNIFLEKAIGYQPSAVREMVIGFHESYNAGS